MQVKIHCCQIGDGKKKKQTKNSPWVVLQSNPPTKSFLEDYIYRHQVRNALVFFFSK